MATFRAGPWSKKDKQYIEQYHKVKSADEIATHLRRNVKAVRRYIRDTFATSFTATTKEAEYDIQTSIIWKDLQKQFSPDELKYFKYHWGRIISQFKDDVYPTEQIQVVDCIKLELLMNRCLNEQQKSMNEIKMNEALLDTERNMDEPDVNRIYNLEKQIAVLRTAQESLLSDYRDMLQRKNLILKEMKATRDARIKSIESYKQSWTGWMIRVLDDQSLRETLGQKIEKMRIAAEQEASRLSEYHEYSDGMVDQPLLTPENIIDEGFIKKRA